MSQPATAGIIVAAIFAAMAILYASYRGYVKWHRRRTVPVDSELPPIREPQSSYISGTVNSHPSWPTSSGSMATLYGNSLGPDQKKHMSQSGSRASIGGGSIFRQSLGPEAMSAIRPTTPGGTVYTHSRHDSGPGFFGVAPPPTDSAPDSPIASPDELGVLVPAQPQNAALSHDPTDNRHSRMSSASSTMTLKNTFAGSIYRGSVGNGGFVSSPTFERQQRRDSWLPHSPLNRDSIHIVPPQPLGVGIGSMAQAMDERTLAFSKSSGIGLGEEVFSQQDSVWGAPGSNQTGPAPPGTQSWGSMSQGQRHRYLQDGPSRGLASNASNGSTSTLDRGSGASNSNSQHPYQHSAPGSSRRLPPPSGAQQAQGPAASSLTSRSRTTSATHDSRDGQAVEATQGELPLGLQHREAISHLRAVSSSADAYSNPAAFTAQTSPLQALSQRAPSVSPSPAQSPPPSQLPPPPSPATQTTSPPPSHPGTSEAAAAAPGLHRYHSAASSYVSGGQGHKADDAVPPVPAVHPSPILGAFKRDGSPAESASAHSRPEHNSNSSSAGAYADSGRRVILDHDGKLAVSDATQ